MKGGLMVCATNSDAGKSTFVTGLCRLLSRRGVSVAPFKAQNMALNSFVTADGFEIGRAQGVQALAAGASPDVTMNPLLLKPTGERTSQVVVMGRPWQELDAVAYQEAKPQLFDVVMDALTDLRSRYDVVICEGAGSPTEINLLGRDIVNLPLARRAGLPAIILGDIDRGGVFASLFGTVELLPPELRAHVRGFVVNKLRGDPRLLGDGPADLEARTGVPVIGVLPYLHDVALDAEDSLSLDGRRPRPLGDCEPLVDGLDVAVIRFPRIANFTDLDALAIEPGLSVRYVVDAAGLGQPDLVVLPGTKATVADLEWLRGRGLDRAVGAAVHGGALVLGICGGYQMLGRTIVDEVESGRGMVEGLGWLAIDTVFERDKTTRQRRGHSMGRSVTGYEIHHGNVSRAGPDVGWVHLDDAYGVDDEGAVDTDAAHFLGTSLHGLFESDGFRATFLTEVARRRDKTFVPAGVSFAAARLAQFDRLADSIEAHVDPDRLAELIAAGAP